MVWWILFFIGLVWLIISRVLREGKIKFWKLVGSNPEEAYKYFKDHSDAWSVLDSNQLKDVFAYLKNKHPEYQKKWTGPFRLYVPSIKSVVHIYGKEDLYEQEQDRVTRLLEEKQKETL